MLRRDTRFEARRAAERPPGGGGRSRRIEMIQYEEDVPLVDHKGRSKPLYKASRPKPASWRPSRFTRLILGLFPGVRAMALADMKNGLFYALPGIAVAVTAVLLFNAWAKSYETFQVLAMKEKWLLYHAAALLGAVLLFELLRMLAALDENIRGPSAPRALAALFVPSLAVLYAAPKVVSFWPRLVEAAALASGVLLLGALPAAVWSIGMAFARSPRAEKILRWTCVGIGAVGFLAAGVVFATMGDTVAAALTRRGFEVLPALLLG